MKKIKKIVAGILSVVFLSFVLYSCSNDVDLPKEKQTEEFLPKATKGLNLKEVSNLISKDNDFILLSESLEIFSENDKQPEVIHQITSQENISETQRLQLAKALGFSSVENAYSFEVNNATYVKNIFSKYDLSRLNNEELNVLFEDAFVNNSVFGRSCADKLKTCKSKAYALYVIEMSACTVGGLGVGALSFWCAGCAGAVLGTACATAATVYTDGLLNECQDTYDDCIKK